MKFTVLVQSMVLALVVLQAACQSEEAVADKAQSNEAAQINSGQQADLVKVGDIDGIRIKAEQFFSQIDSRFKVASLKPSGVQGFYRVQIVDGPTVYIDESVQYFFSGDLFAAESGRLVNLSELSLAEERTALMSQLDASNMIIFPAKGEQKAQITVFTDVDCFYCQKLHQEVPKLNEMGISVRYMAFPRAGIGSGSYKKVVSAWCSDDQQEAMDKLKARQNIPNKTCTNPVEQHYVMGKNMGVTGTPAILLDDGTIIPGYRPAADLAKSLGVN